MTGENISIQDWLEFIESIVHDLRTPLVSLGFEGETLAEMLPALIKAYRVATQHQLIENTLNERQLKTLEQNGFDSISQDVASIQDFLTAIHEYGEMLHSDHFKTQFLSLQSCLDEFLKHHASQRHLIHVDLKNDFNFKANSIFTKYLFLNLFEEMLSYSTNNTEMKINISAMQENNQLMVRFENISNNSREKYFKAILKRFFSKEGEEKNQKIIPGLGFCRLALLKINGDLFLETEKEKNVSFIAKFPTN